MQNLNLGKSNLNFTDPLDCPTLIKTRYAFEGDSKSKGARTTGLREEPVRAENLPAGGAGHFRDQRKRLGKRLLTLSMHLALHVARGCSSGFLRSLRSNQYAAAPRPARLAPPSPFPLTTLINDPPV